MQDHDGNDPIVRVHVWVKGRVQGVGFRAHVEYHARRIGNLTGWVRNVGSDNVEAIAEGRRSDIQALIEKMKEGPKMSRVDEATVEWEEASREFRSFRVSPR